MRQRKRAAFLTLGCKVNQYETDAMTELLEKAGYEIVPFQENADFYIINTCSVTNMAERKSRQMIHRAKKNHPDSVVVAVGCYVQTAASDLKQEYAVDLLIGNNKKKDIAAILERYELEKVGLKGHGLEDQELQKDGLENWKSKKDDLKKYSLESQESKKDGLKKHDLQNQESKKDGLKERGLKDPESEGDEKEKEDTENIMENVIDIAHTKEYESLAIQRTMEHTRVYVKIQDGCNQFCSYCLIPYTRGRVRSRAKAAILDEVKTLAGNGYQEIVLTGIHISSYGQDLQKDSLQSLLEKLHEIEGIERIRLGSLEPRIITEEFVKSISSLPKICPHFHLSLQSGCDATLKRMNRKYTTKEYETACHLLRKYYDKPALTTDVIVGFPGETEQEFEQTVEFLERIHLYEMHVFQYSKRRGTKAERMENQVDPSVKQKRSKILLDMTARQKREYEESFFGKEEVVLVEEKIAQNNEEYFTGHTKRYLKLAILSHKNIEKQMVRVKIIGYSNENRLMAETLD